MTACNLLLPVNNYSIFKDLFVLRKRTHLAQLLKSNHRRRYLPLSTFFCVPPYYTGKMNAIDRNDSAPHFRSEPSHN